ncbi:hypothetical protein [Bacillus dakarensis]|uniref:hypothetical protein n=1 Tax=Robertmurraya dakarensis TaxID=1926278 RepID=UPI000981DF0E|nr:hypothetical protein [Bacillus dakarensis]
MLLDLLVDMYHSPYIIFLAILALVVVAIFMVRAYLLKKSVAILVKKLSELKESNPEASDKEIAHLFNEIIASENVSEAIKECWDQYYKDLKDSQVPPDVYQYFTEKLLVNGYGYRKIAESIPAVFLSLGILGTFYGIAAGMKKIDPYAPSEELRLGIANLMGGMEIAFHSSIVGIILSLLIQFIDKGYIYKTLTSSFRVLRNAMDKAFPVKTESDFLNDILADQTTKSEGLKQFVIQDYLSAMKNEITDIVNDRLIPYYTRDQEIYETQVSLLSSMESHLRHDLAIQIGSEVRDIVTGTLNPIIEQLHEAQKQQNTKLTEVNESIVKELPQLLKQDLIEVMDNNFRPHFEQNNQIMAEMAEGTQTVLREHMDQMVDHFVGTMKDMAGEQIEKLQGILTQTMDWQTKVYGELNQLVEKLQVSADRQSDMADKSSTLSDKLQEFVSVFNEYQESLVGSISELMTVTDHNKSIQTHTGKLLEQISSEKEVHGKAIVEMIGKLVNVTDNLDKQAAALGDMQKEMSTLSATYNQVEILIESLEKSTEKQTQLAAKTSELFKENEKFAEQLSDYQVKTAESSEKLSESALKQVETHEKMSGLLQDITKERMNMLKEFENQLKQFSESSHVMKEQGEMLNSLQKTMVSSIEKYNNSTKGLEELTLTNKYLADNLSDYTGKINQSAKGLEQILANAGKNIELQHQIQKDLNGIVNKFTVERVQFEKLTKEEMNTLKEQLKNADQRSKQLQAFWKDNVEQLKHGHRMFADLNEKLDKSMEHFADHMYRGLDRTFTQFDKQLSTSVSYLDRGVGSIKTVVDDMEESFTGIHRSIRSFQESLEQAAISKESEK